MKKTIVVLLIMACVFSNLFAIPPIEGVRPTVTQLIINADVGATNIIKVTDQEHVFSTYEALASLPDCVTSSTVINSSNYRAKSVSVGYLNYFTNQTEGLSTKVTATPLTMGLSNTENAITYTLRLDGYPVAHAAKPVEEGEQGAAAPEPEEVVLVGPNHDVFRQGSKAISVSIDYDSFETAKKGGGYSGAVTFSYIVK